MITHRIATDKGFCLVSRTIVYDDNLQGRLRLREHRLYRLNEQMLPIIGGNDGAYLEII